ncbi:MAG: hypothetical protein IH607_07180 [Firmicutes bacterium]|nr:hypothetical protein [Bacillota bacterium]
MRIQTLQPCRRCLLEDMDGEQALYALVQSRIAQLAASEKTSGAAYRHRLSLCKACDQLRGGTCGQCGCYVELRAIKRGMHCPLTPPRR